MDQIDAAMVPDVTQVAMMFSKVPRRKAAGQDQISSDIISQFPGEVARHYSPIMAKTSLMQQEALAWKHGTVVPIPKGGGDSAQLVNYRSILLNGVISKVYHRFLRQQLAGYLDLALRDSQCGGRARHGPPQLVHLVTSYIHMARALGRGVVLKTTD